MKSFLDASEAVVEYLSHHIDEVSSPPMIGKVERLPSNVGWVFFYNSEKCYKTENPLDGYAGNAPIIYDRIKGSLHVTGTAHETEYYIKEYIKLNNYSDN